MVFIKGGPATGGGGKKKEGIEEKDRDRGHKNTHKNFACRAEKICRSDEKTLKERTELIHALFLFINLIVVSHNYGRVTRCVRTLHRIILLAKLIKQT